MSPTVYTDRAGRRWRPAGVVPYSELTPGDRFTFPGEAGVYVRGAAEVPTGEAFRLVGDLYHRPAILLEPDDGPPA